VYTNYDRSPYVNPPVPNVPVSTDPVSYLNALNAVPTPAEYKNIPEEFLDPFTQGWFFILSI
jgi:hypothetical protein